MTKPYTNEDAKREDGTIAWVARFDPICAAGKHEEQLWLAGMDNERVMEET